METARLCAVAALALAAFSPLSAMNNADVIRMQQAELSEQTILMAISKEPADYDTSADALIELKKAGVPEVAIQQIVASRRGGARPSASENAAAAPVAEPVQPTSPPPPAPTIVRPAYFDQDFPSIAPPLITPVAGQQYFLRSSLHVEGGDYVGTNYARGLVVPINTPVQIDSIKSSSIALHRVDTGDKFEIKNIEKYTKKSMMELGRLLLADAPTPLDRLPPDLAASIAAGEMRKGMTKEQVLMARGYPPAHETPSVESDRWVYWSSRFVKQTIVFTNGRLTEGRGID